MLFEKNDFFLKTHLEYRLMIGSKRMVYVYFSAKNNAL